MPNAARVTSAARITASDLGAIQNKMGFLSEDYTKLRPRVLMKATGLGAATLSTQLGQVRTHMYREEIPLSTRLKKCVLDLVQTTDLAFELFQGDLEETRRWMMLPNTMLFGQSPFEACFSGKGADLITWLNTRLNRLPGSAF